MSKILHHTDDDGFCAAAIARLQIIPTGAVLTENDLTTYSHTGNIAIPEFTEGETVVVVDLALDKEVMKYIKAAVKAKCKVIHIDHHKTTLEYLQNMSKVEQKAMSKVKSFYNTKYSASLLAYIYASAPDDVKGHTMGFYVNEEEHAYYLDSEADLKPTPKHMIPPIVTYINDYDTSGPFNHKFGHVTQEFHYGFESVFKDPLSPMWEETLYDYSGVIVVDDCILEGRKMYIRELKRTEINAKKNAFEVNCFGIPAICLNTCGVSIEIGEEMYNKYAIMILYHYTGTVWRYSIYNNPKVKLVDVSRIAKYFGGGGHAAAAGFAQKRNIFDSKRGKLYEWRNAPYNSLPIK